MIIAVLDVETTGTNPEHDQIVELSICLYLAGDSPSDAARAAFSTWRVRPRVRIAEDATKCHGIRDEDLVHCPYFEEIASEVVSILSTANLLCAFNGSFDLEMLRAEFARLARGGLTYDVSWADRPLLDPYRLWLQMEPRDLQSAHKRFCGESFEGAHGAEADVRATIRVLNGMASAFGLMDRSWAEIANLCEPERARWVGATHHLVRDDDGVVRLNFGKNKGADVLHVGDDYLNWICRKDFPKHVKDVCYAAASYSREEFDEWVDKNYPRRA